MIKRIFDFVLALVGLLIFFPFLFVIALLIKFDSEGPIFFIQLRIGRNAKPFKMIKFRSMYILQENTSSISFKGDERITRLGSFLRRYKLDEIPELLNVLRGDMSLVGPRPDVPGYADNLKGDAKKILLLRPGITGPASLKYFKEEELLSKQENPKLYNDEIIYPDKVKINLDYYKNQSLWVDIKIIFATIFRVSFSSE